LGRLGFFRRHFGLGSWFVIAVLDWFDPATGFCNIGHRRHLFFDLL
jgi:hypothetical protein